jgi:hypothetical protein
MLDAMAIEKSVGQTATEQYLSHLCDGTFLRPWSYANPFKADGKELCDLIAVFEDTIFLFFDRESRKFDREGDVLLTWGRWKKEAIEKQIRTASGAKRYVLGNRDQIFLDANGSKPLPVTIPKGDLRIFKIVVAHGAKEACEQFSSDNVYGSLAVSYSDKPESFSHPFFASLDRTDPVHVLDSHNLELVLGELDTVYDLRTYLTVKEEAIQRYRHLNYCGEEDLLAHYFNNFNAATKSYSIGPEDGDFDGLMIGEGEWRDFVESDRYKQRKAANNVSYLWDRLIQKTGENALKGVLGGNSNLFQGQSAIHEMAKEPRLSRRMICSMMVTAMNNFPDNAKGIVRNLTLMPSFYSGVGYVFLQLFQEDRGDYDSEYRPLRQKLLEFSCGAAKLKWPHLTKVIGIGIDAPKHHRTNSEDFILLNCEDWTQEDRSYFEEANATLRLFQTSSLTEHHMRATEFPGG